jgi:hypothetical protein
LYRKRQKEKPKLLLIRYELFIDGKV